MKLDFRPIRKRIELSEYAPELEGGYIDVQVNVSREMRLRMLAVSAETPREEFLGLLGELWDAPDTPWPMEDIQALLKHCEENDPQLWKWVTRRTFEVVLAHLGAAKKK